MLTAHRSPAAQENRDADHLCSALIFRGARPIHRGSSLPARVPRQDGRKPRRRWTRAPPRSSRTMPAPSCAAGTGTIFFPHIRLEPADRSATTFTIGVNTARNGGGPSWHRCARLVGTILGTLISAGGTFVSAAAGAASLCQGPVGGCVQKRRRVFSLPEFSATYRGENGGCRVCPARED